MLDPDLLAQHRQELRRGTSSLACLALLAAQPDYGYNLIGRLAHLGFEVEANTLYPLLRRLDKQGLLTFEWDTSEVRPRKTYSTSAAGLELLQEMREDWTRLSQAFDQIGQDSMTTLTDRYVAATVARTPAHQREEVEQDVRAAIADAIDAHLDSAAGTRDPSSASAAETAVLNQMGDPERLAATYADRRLTLIGPEFYLHWKRLTVLLLSIVLPIIAILIPLGMWLGDEPVGAIIGTTLGGTLTVGVHLVFWVTLVFAVLERAGSGPEDWAEPWTVERLKETPDVRVSWAETVIAVVTLAATSIFLVWQQLWPWATTESGEGLPVLNPDLWTFVLPGLLAVLAVELVAVIVRQVRGRWAMGDWWLTLALDVATVVLIAIPVLSHDLLNRELFAQIGWPDAATTITLDQVEWILLVIVAVTCIADAWGSYRRARRSGR